MKNKKHHPDPTSGAPWQPEQSVSYWVNQASRAILKHFESRLRPLGFGMAYLPVVLALETQGTQTQKQLASLVQVEQPTMAALLKRMERDQLIFREQNPDDRRSQFFALTPLGHERLPQVKACLNQEAAVLMKGFSAQEQGLFIELLKKLLGNLEPDSEPGPEF
jgi:MarR family transcriptional regulator for hemolysin